MFWGPGLSLACSDLVSTTYYKEAESSKGWYVTLQLEDRGSQLTSDSVILWLYQLARSKSKFTATLLQNWPCYFWISASTPVNICIRNRVWEESNLQAMVSA